MQIIAPASSSNNPSSDNPPSDISSSDNPDDSNEILPVHRRQITPPPPTPHLDLIMRLNANDGVFYLGRGDLDKIAEYRIGGREGDILVVKENDPKCTEFVMRGVFEIERRDFFMTPDANFDPHNVLDMKLESAKATCQLSAVKRDSRFAFAVSDFTNVVKNLRALENLMPKPKGATERLSVVSGGLNVTSAVNCTIKLSHSLFSRKPDENDLPTGSADDDEDNDSDTIDTQYELATWPVAKRCEGERAKIAKTHTVNPLPAYGTKGLRIPPKEYEKRLSGAVVEAHFGLVHHYIRGKQRSVFTTVLRELNVLRPPVHTIASPVKKRRKLARSYNNASNTFRISAATLT